MTNPVNSNDQSNTPPNSTHDAISQTVRELMEQVESLQEAVQTLEARIAELVPDYGSARF